MVATARTLAAALTLLGLAGCSGLDAEGEGDDSTTGDVYADRFEAGEIVRNEAFEAGFTDLSLLPTTGEASYAGDARAALGTGGDVARVIGQMELVVGFSGGGSLDGTIDDFIDEDDAAVTGRIVISEGGIDRSPDSVEPVAAALLSGELITPDGVAYDVEGTLAGDFHGDGAGLMTGELIGEACAGIGCEAFQGDFAVTQGAVFE